jgi:hypothetical protein
LTALSCGEILVSSYAGRSDKSNLHGPPVVRQLREKVATGDIQEDFRDSGPWDIRCSHVSTRTDRSNSRHLRCCWCLDGAVFGTVWSLPTTMRFGCSVPSLGPPYPRSWTHRILQDRKHPNTKRRRTPTTLVSNFVSADSVQLCRPDSVIAVAESISRMVF